MRKINNFKSDHGVKWNECTSNEMIEFCQKNEILYDVNVPYTPHNLMELPKIKHLGIMED